jgi:hypothetical protein
VTHEVWGELQQGAHFRNLHWISRDRVFERLNVMQLVGYARRTRNETHMGSIIKPRQCSVRETHECMPLVMLLRYEPVGLANNSTAAQAA